MKKFQKISDSLFKEIPMHKMHSITGGRDASLTCISSTCSCESVDYSDTDNGVH